MTIDNLGNVGIGVSPTNVNGYKTLNVGAGSIGSIIKIDGVNAGHYHRILNNNGQLFIQADQGNTTGSSGIVFGVDGPERMRIDASGNVLVGKSATAFGTVGIRLEGPNGKIEATRNNNIVMDLNRLSGNGTIANFSKDSATVGSIGVINNNNLTIGGDFANHAGMEFGTQQISPRSGGTTIDATVDLGYFSLRWRDLYLSGGVYLGGTGAANKLDDYEEGTWTPTLGSSVPLTSATGKFTKIGNRFFFTAEITVGATSNTGHSYMVLPVASSNNVANQGGASIAWTDYGAATYAYILANNNRFYFRSVTGGALTYANISGKSFRVSGNCEVA